MAKVKPGLGRGLDALLKPRDNDEPKDRTQKTLPDKKGSTQDIPIELIEPNPFQPRTVFDPEALEELKKSILVNGLIQPITVREIEGGRYQLISGERRFRAFKEIGHTHIPAYIMKVASDELMLAMALIENIQRERLNPVEVGQAYKRLMDECGLTQEEIADRVGKDRTTIANSIRLLKLPDIIRESLVKEEISMGHARALINVPNKSDQSYILKKILEGNLSVRKVEKLVKDVLAGKTGGKTSGKSKNQSGQKDVSIGSLEENLRKVFGTKVICKQKNNGAGEITIEFYSEDELERLLELFNFLEKNYS